eukprot:g4150.t1
MQNKAALTTEVKFRSLHKTQRCYGPGSVSCALRSSGVQTNAQATSLTSLLQSNTKNRSEVVEKQHYYGKKALIVGAGPAGSVAASFLAKQGFHVDVYEKRADPGQGNTTQSRSFPITLTQNTANVLRAVDVSLPDVDSGFLNGVHPHHGVVFLFKDKPTKLRLPISKERLRAERNDLAKHIIDSVRSKNPDKVVFHFEHTCVGIKLEDQEIQFQNQDNTIIKKSYDLLIGADGANSEVRTVMENEIESFTVSHKPSNLYYKSYRDIYINEDTVSDQYKKMFDWRYSSLYQKEFRYPESKEGLQTITFHRISNGNLIGNFYGTASAFDRIKGNEKKHIIDALSQDFPENWIDQMVPYLKEEQMYKVPSIIEVSSLVGPNVALIGDAAHAVGPAIGYGCNMAIQDSEALYNALEIANGSIEEALKRYNDLRFEQIRHIQLMAEVRNRMAFVFNLCCNC